MTTKPTDKKVERECRLRWVPLAQMRINPMAQRKLNQARVDKIVSEMDLEQLGNPTVNLRADWFFIVDGQHRIEALKKWMGEGSWEDTTYQCWTYEGLTEQEEAEKFLTLNDVLVVRGFDKFEKSVNAGRPEESDIDRIVRSQGLRVSRNKSGGAIRAVASLKKVYHFGPGVLARSIGIIRDSYGDAGFEAPVIEGIGVLCQRYNGDLDEGTAVQRLKKANGGVNGLMNSAEQLWMKTGSPRAHCVAAAAVDIYNRGRGGKKLASFWRTES